MGVDVSAEYFSDDGHSGRARPAAVAQSTAHMMVTPNDLVWADMPSLPPGAKVAVFQGPLNEAVPFTLRLKLPANYEIPAHWHPWIEHATVISGNLNMGVGDKLNRSQTKTLPAGSVAVVQPKTNHFSWTQEETIVQVHGVGPLVIHTSTPQTIRERNSKVERASRLLPERFKLV